MNCVICKQTDDTFCGNCGEPVCDTHLRVPDTDDPELLIDYCVQCYADAGYVDIYDITYRSIFGDVEKTYVDVPVGSKLGDVAMWVAGGDHIPLLEKVLKYRKVEKWI